MPDKLNQLAKGHGALKPGHGLISGIKFPFTCKG